MPRLPKLTPRKLAHAHRIVNGAKEPPKPKLRRRTRPHLLKTSVLKQIPGTRGLWSVLAKRLGCVVSTVQRAMAQDGWEWVREAMEQEKLAAKEGCVERVYDLARHCPSFDTQLNASKFILEKTHPDFQTKSKVQIEGGDNPIKHQHAVIHVTPEILKAPIEDRIQLLENLADKVNVETDR